ncbi:serine hydrolase domain-containing protein [Ruania zhangjianzhongii]|uniref:serine hydrolase domain-containing protein n=1 Tax=Ruania zhangjianzhongii TaxID=2603206 RepID=UPI0011CBBDD5|nr:serine hydrolase domain-containing protein [Ruania zhangjianzhongii]
MKNLGNHRPARKRARWGICAVAALLAAIVIWVGSPVGPASAAPVAPERLDTEAVDSYVEDYLDRHGLVGAAVAVVHDGEVLHTAGYGDSGDAGTRADTPMATGSVSKQMTAFAILQLVDDGTVDLDDPVIEHLPEFALADERASDITIRHLLSHTSGLPNPVIVEPASDLTEGVQRLHDWQLDADPGEQYSYSNFNYHAAARLIETVTGVPFATYLQDRLFQPLGMADTRSVDTTSADDAGLQGGHVTAYGTALPLREMEQLVAGAGGVISTAEDQARWLAMLTNGGTTPDGEQLLSPELLDEAQSPQPGTDGEGLGWHLSSESVDPPRIGHSGATSRYSAQLDIVPSSGYGVVVMLNSYTPTAEHNYAIGSGIIDITEGSTPELGTPVPTLLDAGLGLVTLLVIALTATGIRRADRWSQRRASWPRWRLGLRLLPQTIGPVLAILVFLVLPSLEGQATTPVDVFALWPAAMVVLLALAASGAALLIARGVHRGTRKPAETSPTDTGPSDTGPSDTAHAAE